MWKSYLMVGMAAVLAFCASGCSGLMQNDTESEQDSLAETVTQEVQQSSQAEPGETTEEVSDETSETAAFATEESASETETPESSSVASEISSGTLFDFQIVLDGETYAVPISYADFSAAGWTWKNSEDAAQELESNQYSLGVQLVKDDFQITAQMLNLSDTTQPLSACALGTITVDTYYLEDTSHTVSLPGDIVIGTANMDAVTATYGEPDDVYEGTSITTYTYEQSLYQQVKLTFDTDTGVSTKVEVQNFGA